MAQESGILETIGTIFGLVTGGPVGAAKGRFVGNLLGGGNLKDAFSSGIGTLFNTSPQLGMAAQLFDFGDSSITGAASTAAAPGAASPNQGGVSPNLFSQLGVGQPTQATNPAGLFNSLISQETDNPLNALLVSLALNQMTKNKNPFSALEQRQYETGERNPDYRGTPVPDYRYMPSVRPGVIGAAAGGMIEGPGSGKSDSIPAKIYQGGSPVQEARLSDGEFVMTADAVRGAGNGNRAKGAAQMYRMMNRLEGVA
jgi:hypothetical protein